LTSLEPWRTLLSAMRNRPKRDKPPPEHHVPEVGMPFNEFSGCCFFRSAEVTVQLFRKGIEIDRLK
jgi:hypothetical protein